MKVLWVAASLSLFGSFAAAQALTVFAASSLTEAFGELARAFEDANPEVRVTLNLAGSSTLAMQIIQGAPADVFASADSEQMQRVADEGLLAGEARTFAHNRLVVVTPAGSSIKTLADLARPGLLLVLAGPEVPAGHYARLVLDNLDSMYGEGFAARVLDNLASEEPNVRQVAAKVELGEADAAVVYATDAALLEGVKVLDIPAAYNVSAAYTLAALKGERREEAEAFVMFVLSEAGQAILARHGFEF